MGGFGAEWRGIYLECLGRVVARVDRVLVLAGIRVHLPAVHFDGLQLQLPVSSLLEFAVLPLDYSLRALGVCGCWGVSIVLVVVSLPSCRASRRVPREEVTYGSRQRGSMIPRSSRRR